jgi:hypothetical protein
MEDWIEEASEQRLHDARMAHEATAVAELARLKSVNADLLAACEAAIRIIEGEGIENNDTAIVRAAWAKAKGITPI